MKLPWFKFFPSDWTHDPNLRRCSHAAKGVFIDALAIAFDCEERGVLISNKVPWSLEEIAYAVGGNADVTLKSLKELVDKFVLKKRTDGAYFSSRMVKDSHSREATRKRVKRFRNAGCNADVTLDEQKTHENVTDKKSEVRSQKSEEKASPQLVFPDNLKSDRFRNEFVRWTEFRRAKGGLKSGHWDRLFKDQLEMLSRYGEDIAILTLEHSRVNGYTGLFPEKHSKPAIMVLPKPAKVFSAAEWEAANNQPKEDYGTVSASHAAQS